MLPAPFLNLLEETVCIEIGDELVIIHPDFLCLVAGREKQSIKPGNQVRSRLGLELFGEVMHPGQGRGAV